MNSFSLTIWIYQTYHILIKLIILLNDDYLSSSNIIKKKILTLADKMYRKKINVTEKITNEIYFLEIN